MEALDEAVAETIAGNAELAAAVRRGTPKAWGALAAQGVQAYRAKVGRALRDDERRALWSALWREATR